MASSTANRKKNQQQQQQKETKEQQREHVFEREREERERIGHTKRSLLPPAAFSLSLFILVWRLADGFASSALAPAALEVVFCFVVPSFFVNPPMNEQPRGWENIVRCVSSALWRKSHTRTRG